MVTLYIRIEKAQINAKKIPYKPLSELINTIRIELRRNNLLF
jgi:hypothetical protein